MGEKNQKLLRKLLQEIMGRKSNPCMAEKLRGNVLKILRRFNKK